MPNSSLFIQIFLSSPLPFFVIFYSLIYVSMRMTFLSTFVPSYPSFSCNWGEYRLEYFVTTVQERNNKECRFSVTVFGSVCRVSHFPVRCLLSVHTTVWHVQCFFYLAQQPPVDQGLLIHEVSRSHTTTHHSR